MSTNCSHHKSFESMKSLATTILVPWIKADSRDIHNVGFVCNGFTVMTNFMPIVETSTKDVIFVIGEAKGGSNSTFKTTTRWRNIFEGIISYALIRNVWNRNLWSLDRKWILKPISLKFIPMDCLRMRDEMPGRLIYRVSTTGHRHQDSRASRGDRSGRTGRGRGRDPNSEVLPASSAQPMRRDEIAYQRQMAIQSAQSVTTRSFGAQLTPAQATRPVSRNLDTASTPSQSTATTTSMPAIDSLNLTSNPPPSSQPAQALTPQEQARRLQHASVMDRASSMLRNNATKISDFRAGVSAYRNSTISASRLIDTFFTLFDVSSTDLGKLMKELADIYENDAKRAGLLKAWNDWRAINEDYPSLPGPSGVLPGTAAAAAGAGGRRVLKLKSSTAQSSRSAVSKQGSWGNIAHGANPFPSSTPTGSRQGKNTISSSRGGGGGVHAPSWIAGSSSKPSSSSPSSSGPSPRPVSRPTTATTNSNAPAGSGGDAFPALPQAARPNTLMLGMTRGAVRWDDPRSLAPPTPAWGAGGSSSGSGAGMPSAASGGEEVDGVVDNAGAGKGKGKKVKKQTLYKFG